MTKKTKIDWKIVVAAIAGIVILECYALSKGINGVLLTTVIAAIAALGANQLPAIKTQ